MPNARNKPKRPDNYPLVIWETDGPLPVRAEEIDLLLSTMRALERLQEAMNAEVLAPTPVQLHDDTNNLERRQ